MEKTEFDLVRELNNYNNKNGLDCDDLQNAIEIVEDLLTMFTRNIEVNEPNAINSINDLVKAKYEVTKLYHEVSDYLSFD